MSLALPLGCGSSSADEASSPASSIRDEAAAREDRGACKFARGALPAQTLGEEVPRGKDIPIDTIVVLMMENHSFDHYFGHLGKFAGRTDIESAPDMTTNPEKAGQEGGVTHPYQHAPHLCTLDTNHEWSGSHVQYDDGKMDGFFETNQGWSELDLPAASDPALKSGERALYWYDERDIPFYYSLASTFAIADHYHCSLLGPTWPNRMFLISATSFGVTKNSFPNVSGYPYPDRPASVLDELEQAHVSWGLYGDSVPGAAVVYNVGIANRWDRPVKSNVSTFLKQAAEGTLPNVSFLDPRIGQEGPDQNDEHPPADIQVGQKFVSDTIQALFASPQWPHMALFLVWDEHGGYYDHVPPPPACAPDDTPPALDPGDTTVGGFDRYGMRVPFVLVSPYAKRSYVGHNIYDHASITRFIETRFELPALTARDANADPMIDLFDFKTPAFQTPPTLAQPTIDQAELAFCKSTYGKK